MSDNSYVSFSKNQCNVEVIAATLNTYSGRIIYTFRLTYPRFIHSELMTHRQLCRNSASSRATPTKVITDRVRNDPAFFEELGINQPGMVADKVLSEEDTEKFKKDWTTLARTTADIVDSWIEEYHLHKQIANRILEPFMKTSTIVTTTEWDNYLDTRIEKHVEPTMRSLSKLIQQAIYFSNECIYNSKGTYYYITNRRKYHLPFVTETELNTEDIKSQLIHSVARCARCTILSNVSKKQSTLEEDKNLYDRLINAKPMHASPFEHQAYAQSNYEPYYMLRGGWMSYRYAIDQMNLLRKSFML